MKKTLLILIVCIIILFIGTFTSVVTDKLIMQESTCKIFINSEEQNFDSVLVNINGRTYVPLREMCKKIDYDLEWNGEKREIELTKRFDFSKSEEGFLDNGIKYEYTSEKFVSKKFVEENNMYFSREENKEKKIPTPKRSSRISSTIFYHWISNFRCAYSCFL